MSKAEIIETIRESIRQLRVERDAGSTTAHDMILKLTTLISRVQKMPANDARILASNYGIDA